MDTMRGILLAGVFAAAVPMHAASTPAPPKFTVPFIDDDYARALTEARAKNVPIFVENWAPW
jgi:hypothetical protein